MRYLTVQEVLIIQRRILEQSGGAAGILRMPTLESALSLPQMTFDGEDLYPTLVEKAAILGFSLIMNHPFVDGNKRTGHAVMETFLLLNGHEIIASVDEQEAVVLSLAAGRLSREEFSEWLRLHVTTNV